MASPDRIKIGAYLSESENEALRRVADSLGVSASKAVAMAIKAMDEKIHKGGKVSLPVTTSTGDKVELSLPPDIASLIKREVEVAIAALKTELLETIHPSEPLDRIDPVDAAPINYFPELDNETAVSFAAPTAYGDR